jgi:hypothetical protein
MIGRPWILNTASLFQGDGRWREQTFQRKIAGIRHALENPMRYAWKLARALRNPRYLILAPTIPRTTPRRDECEYWDEFKKSAEEAEFQYHDYWRRRRDSS